MFFMRNTTDSQFLICSWDKSHRFCSITSHYVLPMIRMLSYTFWLRWFGWLIMFTPTMFDFWNPNFCLINHSKPPCVLGTNHICVLAHDLKSRCFSYLLGMSPLLFGSTQIPQLGPPQSLLHGICIIIYPISRILVGKHTSSMEHLGI